MRDRNRKAAAGFLAFLALGSGGFCLAILPSLSSKLLFVIVRLQRAACLNFASWVCLGFVMASEYIIYCDESESKGRHFSNFYGGALVRSDDIDRIRREIAEKKHDLNLFGEVKWSKLTVNYFAKYMELIDFFLDYVGSDEIKLRVMFTQNTVRPRNLTADQIKNQYAILYYFFIRHAFGLVYSPTRRGGVDVRIYPDQLPLAPDQVKVFKSYLVRLANRAEFRAKGIRIARENIVEVVSHDHDILQCLDIILGAMNFYLNDKHLDEPDGKARRSPKTRAKEKLYRQINRRIREIYPNFNIGITTGHQGDVSNRWRHQYRHWNFQATDRDILPGSKKKR